MACLSFGTRRKNFSSVSSSESRRSISRRRIAAAVNDLLTEASSNSVSGALGRFP